MSVTGCVLTYKITSCHRNWECQVISLAIYGFDFPCPACLIIFRKSFVFLKVTVSTVRLKARLIQPTSHRLSDTDWSFNWYIHADRSPQESWFLQDKVFGKKICRKGKWQNFKATWQLSITHKVEAEYMSKQMVRFLICIKVLINTVLLSHINVI